MNSAAWVPVWTHTNFKNTDRGPSVSDLGQGTRCAPWSNRSSQPSAGSRWCAGPGPPLSPHWLSQWRLLPLLPFLHCQGKLPPPSHRRLVTDLLRHWAIPCAQLIYTSLVSFCPRYQHHRAIPPLSTIDHAGDLHPPPARAFPTTSQHWQGPPPCS
jgi:hypothetical protein